MIFKYKTLLTISIAIGMYNSCITRQDDNQSRDYKSVQMPMDMEYINVEGKTYGEIFQMVFSRSGERQQSAPLSKTVKSSALLLFDDVRALTYQNILMDYEHSGGEVPEDLYEHVNRYQAYNPQPGNTEPWGTQAAWYEKHPGYNVLSNTALKRSGEYVEGEVKVKKGTTTDLLVLFIYEDEPVWMVTNYYYWYEGCDYGDECSSSDEWGEYGYDQPLANAQPDTTSSGITTEPFDITQVCANIITACAAASGYRDEADCQSRKMAACQQDGTAYFACMSACTPTICQEFEACESACWTSGCQ